MIKTGEKSVDEILEAIDKVPGTGLNKALAVKRIAEIAVIYLNETDSSIEAVFGPPSKLLQNDVESNLLETARE